MALCALAAASPEARAQAVRFEIDGEDRHQTIDNFGASDAWTMRFLGEAADSVVSRAADLLFSLECDKGGKPVGIGLSIWRFNLTAGSVEQGDASGINFDTRGESFFSPEGGYDWDRLAGQRRFLREARRRGVEQFLMFLNSPDVRFTRNGLATNTGGDHTYNLRKGAADELVGYLADVIEGIEAHDSVRFDYISPFNEPDGHWNWIGPKQEGTPATNREIATVTRLLGAEFARRGIGTRIIIPESSDYRCLTATHPQCDWQRGHELRAFFTRDSVETYVGDVTNVPRLIAGHSYWTNTPLDMLRDMRVALGDSLRRQGIDFWQTEYCIMGNDDEIGGGGGYDYSMRTALYVARVVHHDLVYADAHAWQWWRAAGGDYKDGLLREFRSEDGLRSVGVRDSKLLWVLGNYSRFVRPQAQRVGVRCAEIEDATDPHGLMVSAYENADGSCVAVVINYAETPGDIALCWGRRTRWQMYRTSDIEGEDLMPAGEVRGEKAVTIPPRSVVTFVATK